MKNVTYYHTYITSADSDDGLVSVIQAPSTRLSGSETLRDNTTGKLIWRGEYLDANGKVDGTKVPPHIWESAVAVMRDIDVHNGAAEDAAAHSAHLYQDTRFSWTSERIAAEMNREDSDL